MIKVVTTQIEQYEERNIYPWPDFGGVTYVYEDDIDKPLLSDIPYVRVNNICMAEDRDKTAMVWMVHTPSALRGRGLATELMNRVIRDADRRGCQLQLFVIEPDRGKRWISEGVINDPPLPNREQLMRWYRRFGFQSVGEDLVNMIREPRSIHSGTVTDNAGETPGGIDL